MNKTDLPATMFSHDGALVVVGEGVKGSIELFFATWLMGRLFPDVDPSTQSILVLANWLDAAIVVEQFQGEDSFLESTTVDDVNKWIVTGSWASLQSEREVIPSEYVGFDKVKRIHAKDEFSKLLQMRNWKSISHKSGKPEIFVASRRDFNVVLQPHPYPNTNCSKLLIRSHRRSCHPIL